VPTPAEPRGDKRRRDILRALHDCVIANGYSKTTLADVARAARLSPSHLLYYFAGKDAILEYYFADVAERIRQRLQSFGGEPPETQMHSLAELFFAGKGVSKSEVGFMLECFGAAVHDKKLNAEKAALDDYCKAYLRSLFQSTDIGAASARDCAEIAYAMLVGLRTAAYFDETLSAEQARRLFYAEILRLSERGRSNARVSS
jgi:AcrR family transcriptional regulator